MAPGLVETPFKGDDLAVKELKVSPGQFKEVFAYGAAYTNLKLEREGDDKHAAAKYPHYLPVWDAETKYPPLQPFNHYDHGRDADPSFPNLLKNAKVTELTANIGAEISGVQLSKLTKEGKDELARFVAEKKVVAFRDQDFADLPIQEVVEYGRYFGRLHIHPTTGAPEGHPEIHLVHVGAGDKTGLRFLEERTNSIIWHSDITYEEQPPGTTFLYMLDGPTAGGDTLFANQALAYQRLSKEFRKRLHGLKALHSGQDQAQQALSRGSIARREPVENVHPLIRTHPVTGEKALFVNPQFTRRIIGYKREESDYLLNFLYDHIAKGQDFQARVKWAPRTVVVWDNRVTAHSAVFDWADGQRRHIARLTPQAEKPYETPFEESDDAEQ